MGRAELAAFHFRLAHGKRRSLGDVRGEATDRNLLGLELRRLGEPDAARRQFERAEILAAGAGFLAAYAAAINNRGLLEEDTGNYSLARALYRRAWRSATSVGQSRAADEAMLFRRNLARLAVSEDDLEEAQSILTSIAEASRFQSDEALAESAWLQIRQNQPEQALATIDQALVGQSDPLLVKVLLDRRGTALAQLGRYDQAAEAYRRSLRAMPHLPSLEAATVTSLCRLHTLDPLGAPEAASACSRATEIAGGKGIAGAILASSLYWRGRQMLRDGHLFQARRMAARAASIVEKQPAFGAPAEKRSRYFADREGYLALAIDSAMALHRHDPATNLDRLALAELERWRSRALWERIELAREEPRLFHLLQKKRRQLRELGRQDHFEPSALEVWSEALEEEIASLGSLSARTPERQAEACELRELQQLLDAQTLVFELVLGAKRSYLWRIDQRAIESYELPAGMLLESEARHYHELLADPSNLSRRSVLLAQGIRLAEILFGKHMARLEGAKRLVFIGDGALTAFPLAALPTPATRAEAPRFLVEDLEIVHLPSLRSVRALRRTRAASAPASDALALIGDPWYDAGQKELALIPLSAHEAAERAGILPSFPLGRLPFAQHEMDRIASYLRGRGQILRLDGVLAQPGAVLAENLGSFSIVHFSAHGISGKKRDSQALLLSQVDRSGARRSGRLTTGDLENLDWRAELVSVSSCRGIRAESVRLAGLSGLAEGFFLAGAQRTLAASWDVEGAATATLMDHFYRALIKDRLPPAGALQEAQRSLLAEARATKSSWQAPYFWSGFVVTGDWRGFSTA